MCVDKMGSHRRSMAFDTNNSNNKKTIVAPDCSYWRDRLVCKGCYYPLFAPVYYCQNSNRLHLLCKYCSHCSIEDCRSKSSPQRCSTIEKTLRLVSFSCEFRCKRGPFEGEEYRAHVTTCNMRPIMCSVCKTNVQFRGYLNHLIVQHEIRESRMDEDILLINFARGQPGIQYVIFNGERFLVHYEGGRLWVEIWSEEENAHVDYRVRASGVKYRLDFELEVLCPRTGKESVRKYSKDMLTLPRGGPTSNAAKYAVPPPNEELSLRFVYDDDGNSISTFSGDDDDEQRMRAEFV